MGGADIEHWKFCHITRAAYIACELSFNYATFIRKINR
jgi:hypothetical protein